VYVGNLDFSATSISLSLALTDLLSRQTEGVADDAQLPLPLSSHLVRVEVPGWGEVLSCDRARTPEGVVLRIAKPRKKRDEGKRNRGFAVLEFDSTAAAVAACKALDSSGRGGGAVIDGRPLRTSLVVTVRSFDTTVQADGVEVKMSEEAAAAAVTAAAEEEMHQERREHNRRQRRRRKDRDAAVLGDTLNALLASHPLWAGDDDDAAGASESEQSSDGGGGGGSSLHMRGVESNRVKEASPAGELEAEGWWDDDTWRAGWGTLYSRWDSHQSAAALGAYDWSTCSPAVDPAGSNRRGAATRGERKRLQVESFRAIIQAASEAATAVTPAAATSKTTSPAPSSSSSPSSLSFAAPPSSDADDAPNQRQRRQHQRKQQTVVDFGCGTGNLILPLAAASPETDFVGIDLNPRAVELLRERAARAGVKVPSLFNPKSPFPLQP
jgi:hypothetical protein